MGAYSLRAPPLLLLLLLPGKHGWGSKGRVARERTRDPSRHAGSAPWGTQKRRLGAGDPTHAIPSAGGELGGSARFPSVTASRDLLGALGADWYDPGVGSTACIPPTSSFAVQVGKLRPEQGKDLTKAALAGWRAHPPPLGSESLLAPCSEGASRLCPASTMSPVGRSGPDLPPEGCSVGLGGLVVQKDCGSGRAAGGPVRVRLCGCALRTPCMRPQCPGPHYSERLTLPTEFMPVAPPLLGWWRRSRQDPVSRPP